MKADMVEEFEPSGGVSEFRCRFTLRRYIDRKSLKSGKIRFYRCEYRMMGKFYREKLPRQIRVGNVFYKLHRNDPDIFSSIYDVSEGSESVIGTAIYRYHNDNKIFCPSIGKFNLVAKNRSSRRGIIKVENKLYGIAPPYNWESFNELTPDEAELTIDFWKLERVNEEFFAIAEVIEAILEKESAIP